MTNNPSRARETAIPSGRLSRLAGLTGMAGGVVGSLAAGGLREMASGRRPDFRGLLLTPGNLRRVTDQLARMRGAAMKVGQLASMDAGDILPAELSEIMARLRAEADYMPPKQLHGVLVANWGRDWRRGFRRFDTVPIAAASIGQVHRAETKDGRVLAIKVQYPGVRRSIDSDVANVGTLIRMSGLIPSGMEIGGLLEEARRQLHDEADYLREAQALVQFREDLAGDPGFLVPDLAEDLTTRDILAMEFIPSVPIEMVETADQTTRNAVTERLLSLFLREIFTFGRLQSDPNFANYRWQPETGRVVLLDFGATREVPGEVAAGYRDLLAAGLSGDLAQLDAAICAVGFYDDATAPHHRETVRAMASMAFDGLARPGPFDFAADPMIAEIRRMAMDLANERSFGHIPPIETLFVQRKGAGLYLLARRLGAVVDVNAMALGLLERG